MHVPPSKEFPDHFLPQHWLKKLEQEDPPPVFLVVTNQNIHRKLKAHVTLTDFEKQY